jgi:hypothetical protein
MKGHTYVRLPSKAEPVYCDVCGKLFSSRHIKSHKRLAHRGDKTVVHDAEQDPVKAILNLYEALSVENRKLVLAKLAALK